MVKNETSGAQHHRRNRITQYAGRREIRAHIWTRNGAGQNTILCFSYCCASRRFPLRTLQQSIRGTICEAVVATDGRQPMVHNDDFLSSITGILIYFLYFRPRCVLVIAPLNWPARLSSHAGIFSPTRSLCHHGHSAAFAQGG